MPQYNHAYDIAFEVVSGNENGDDVTPEMLKAALMKRIQDLDTEGKGAWLDAASLYDTFEIS